VRRKSALALEISLGFESRENKHASFFALPPCVGSNVFAWARCALPTLRSLIKDANLKVHHARTVK
jgi:hypothetical protein